MALLTQRIRHEWWRWWLVLLALLTPMVCVPRAYAQPASRESELKAVLLYNLTQFVEWPGSAFASNNAPLVIGVLGEDTLGRVLDDAVRGEKYGGRSIVVQRFHAAEEAGGCQILFVCPSENARFQEILSQLKGRAILTVADAEGFIRAGGMIRFVKSPQNKIRLRINAEAAKAAELSVSGKLLRVAEPAHADQD